MRFTLYSQITKDEKRNKRSENPDHRMTFGLLGASFETNNLGVAALACGTVASVFHSYPNARFFILDYGKESASYQVKHPDGVAIVELINIRFSKQFYLRNNIAYLLFLALCIKIMPSRNWRTRLQRHNLVLKIIQEADIIGSIAGGDSFSDIYGLGRLMYVTLPQILVLLLGKPLVLLPQTLGPFNGTLAKAVARSIVRRTRMVYTRDPSGLEAVRDLAGPAHGRADFAFDMGFALIPHIRSERIPSWLTGYDKSTSLVGLNVSGLLYIGGYTRSNMFDIKTDYRELIHNLIEILVRKHRVQVMFVPHVYGIGENSESDVVACRKIYNDVGESVRASLHLIEEEYDQHEMKALIGRCDFFIGSRMHACIAAISQSIPAVGLAYSRKFHGVFDSVGLKELVIDLRKHDETAVIEAVEQAYRFRVDLRTKLDEIIPPIRASVLRLFGSLVSSNVIPGLKR